MLGEFIRHLLPTPAVAAQRASLIPSDCELLVQRLLGTVQPVQPVLRERSSVPDMEVLLQSMLPAVSVAEDTVCACTDRREPMTRCFSCGESDHTTPRCLELDESFRSCQWVGEWIMKIMSLCPKGPTCHPAGNGDWSGEGVSLPDR